MSVFYNYDVMNRAWLRGICFKGADPSDFNQPTPQEYATAETAAKEWNLYLQGKPIEEGYLHDISRDPTEAAQTMKDQAAADFATEAPVSALPNGPNGGMSAAAVMRTAATRAKTMSDLDQVATGQQAAGRKAYIENAMGLQSSADTAQAGLAGEEVRKNLENTQADYNSNAATMGSLASLAGAGAGMAYDWSKSKQA